MNIYIDNILIILIFLFLLLSYKFDENFTNSEKYYDLKKTYILIKDRNLKLINKKDSAVYTNFDIDTYESESGYFNKMYENLFIEKNRKNILVLGFGFGGIPLRLSLDKNVKNIDCVDLDKNLLLEFKNIFPNYSSKIKLIHDDADNFLKKTKNKYDIIIDDVFDGYNKISLDYRLLKEKLNTNGKLYLNNYDINKKNVDIVKKILEIFGNGDNKIISNIDQSVYIFKK